MIAIRNEPYILYTYMYIHVYIVYFFELFKCNLLKTLKKTLTCQVIKILRLLKREFYYVTFEAKIHSVIGTEWYDLDWFLSIFPHLMLLFFFYIYSFFFLEFLFYMQLQSK